MNDLLAQLATNLETAAGEGTTTNSSVTGYAKRIAVAAEVLAGVSTAAAASFEGYLRRAAVALEAVEEITPTGYGNNANGYLARLVAAMEAEAGSGSLLKRAVTSSATYEGGGPGEAPEGFAFVVDENDAYVIDENDAYVIAEIV